MQLITLIWACVLGKTSGLLFLHLLEKIVFGEDKEVLLASDVSKDFARSISSAQ